MAPVKTSFDLKAVEEQLDVTLHGYQVQALDALARGRNVIVHAPTGSGKSAIFQGASLVVDGITVVVYPLRALVKDQARAAEALGLRHVAFYGDTKSQDRGDLLRKIRRGKVDLVLTTPESLKYNIALQRALQQAGIGLLVIDEAHAYEEWALSFRPAYRDAGPVARKLGVRQTMLCSATLTSQGVIEAARTLQTRDWVIVQIPPTRENLMYCDLHGYELKVVDDVVAGRNTVMYPAPGIAFFTTVRRLDGAIAKAPKDFDVLKYHGALGDKARRIAQETWMDNNRWIFATKAFGMGIDKPNVRSIVHFQLPASVLDYAQETGRAGRDGAVSRCWLTQYDHGEVIEFLLNKSLPTPRVVENLWNYLRQVPANKAGWTVIDRDRAGLALDLEPETLSSALSWLRTAKLVRSKRTRKEWVFELDNRSHGEAADYGRGAPEIVSFVEEMGEPCPRGLRIKPELLEEEFGSQWASWKEKFKRLADRGIFGLHIPSAERSKMRLLKEDFEFANEAKRLEEARERALGRLDEMRKLQATDPRNRRSAIERSVGLDVAALRAGLEKLGEETKAEPAEAP